MRFLHASWLLILGLIIGINVGCQFITPAVIFQAIGGPIPDSTAAGTLAGSVFEIVHVVTLIGATVLTGWILFSAARGATTKRRSLVTAGLLSAVVLLVCIEWVYITPRIVTLRTELHQEFGSVSAAPEDDARRGEFGMLHGLSFLRGTLEILLEGTAFILIAAGPPRRDP